MATRGHRSDAVPSVFLMIDYTPVSIVTPPSITIV